MIVVKCKKDFRSFRLYIDDVLYLEMRMENHDSIQSWIDDSNGKRYIIEFTRKEGNPILLELDNIEKWKLILKLIDENI